jgi:hypothetical protein
MNVLKKSILASIGVVLLALTLALTNVAQAAAQALKDVVVVNTTSQPVPVVAQGTTAIKGTVGLDPAANTVKLDPATNTVRAQQSGTWNVGITNSSVPVTGTVNVGNQPTVTVGNQPPFAFDANGNLKTAGTVSQGRAASVVLNKSDTTGSTSFVSPDLAVGQFTELAVDLTFAGNPGCTATLTIYRNPGNLFVIDSTITTVPPLLRNGTVSRSLGMGGPQNVSFGNLIKVLLVLSCSSEVWVLTVIGK